MTARSNWVQASTDAFQAQMQLSTFVEKCGLEPRLLELVKMRASQLNGCAYCLDMHSKDARADGESEQRLYLLGAWRDAAHLYSERERAALAWTEATTTLAGGHVPDAVYEQARRQFTDAELVNVTLAVVVINGWNRLNIAFRTEAGDYRPGQFKRRAG
jgi:AhpD family alkylhydroperoxidase